MFLVTAWVSGCKSGASHEIAKCLTEARQDQVLARSLNRKAIDHYDLKEKRRLLSEAVAKDDFYGEAHNNLGVVLYKQGHIYEAAKHLQRASDLLSANPVPLNNLAVLHMSISQWKRALPFVQSAYKRDSENSTTIHLLVQCLLEQGKSGPELQGYLKKLVLLTSDEQIRSWALERLKIDQDKQFILE